MNTNDTNITWALDKNGYFVGVSPDGQIFRSQGLVNEATQTNPLKFLMIGNLPANITGRTGQLADVGGTNLADRNTAGASSR